MQRIGAFRIALLVALAACRQKSSAPSPSPPTATSAKPAVVATGLPSAEPSPEPSDGGTPATRAATSEPFAGGPKLPTTKLRDTVGGAGGVLIGTPDGWTTENVYSAYDFATPKAPDTHAAVAIYSSVGATADLAPAALVSSAYSALMTGATWGAPVDVAVGDQKWPGKLVTGKGRSLVRSEGEREAFAVIVDVPSRRRVFFLATWLASRPEYAEQLRDMVRGLALCDFKPNKGCVRTPSR